MNQLFFETPAMNLERSKTFFSKVGWHAFSINENSFFTDGVGVFRLNTNPQSRVGFVIRNNDSSLPPPIFKEMKDSWRAICPSGVNITWENGNLLDFEKATNSILGNNQGLTIESIDLPKSIDFYTQLGFEAMDDGSQGYVTLKHSSGFTLTLLKSGMCPHSFCNPSLSFFNGKEGNQLVLEKIRAAGLEIYEEVTYFNPEGLVDNVILREPGGFGFFIFND